MLAITLIAALDRHRAIGRRDGAGVGAGMPWHLPADVARFKRLTLGKPVLMGYRTAAAIGRALPGRPNLVLSRSHDAPFTGQHTVRSLDEATGLGYHELMVAGGGEVYALALPLAGKLHLTVVDGVIADADVFFPDLAGEVWKQTAREHHAADERHVFAFDWVDYVRLPPCPDTRTT
jgi:dihydrofolate reductase